MGYQEALLPGRSSDFQVFANPIRKIDSENERSFATFIRLFITH